MDAPTPAERRTASFRARTAAFAAIATLSLFAIWITLDLGGATATRDFDDLATLLAAAAAATVCLRTAARIDREHRRFWLLLGAASLAWTFGEAAWAVYDVVLDRAVPTPSYADIGYLGAIPLAVAALLSHPARGRDSTATRARAFLDGSILATALLFLSWTYALGPVWQQNDITTSAGLVSVAYPFGDVVVLFLLVRVLLDLAGPQRLAIGLVLAGLFAMAVSDSGYTYLTADRGYVTGNLIDIGWVAAYLAIAAGAWAAGANATTPKTIDARREPTHTSPAVGVLASFLPVLLSLGVVAVRAHSSTALDNASLLLAIALTGLVLMRQGIVAVRPSDRP